jgi:hypothetical protein
MYYMSWASGREDATETATALQAAGMEAYTALPGMPEGAWIVEFGHKDWSDEKLIHEHQLVLEKREAAGIPVSYGSEGPYEWPQYKDDGVGCMGHQCNDETHHPRTFYVVKAEFNEDEQNLREEIKTDAWGFPQIFSAWVPMCFDCIQNLYEEDNDAELKYWGSFSTLQIKLWSNIPAEEKQAILDAIKAREAAINAEAAAYAAGV